MTDENVIYKICSHDEWDNAKKCGIYQGSKDDQRDGFIHFSTKEQVDGTLKKHFKGKNNAQNKFLFYQYVTILEESIIFYQL